MWPDWRGEAVAIIASGPSTKKADVALLEGRIRVLAIKKNVEIAPFADAVYGCDHPWWMSVRGLPDFKGLKMAYADQAVSQYGLRKVAIPDHANSDFLRFETTGTVGSGGCSGFQALNLAVQFGAANILLIGFDVHGRGGDHWYGRNTWHGSANPAGNNFDRWNRAFQTAAGQLRDLDVEVVNASALTDLNCFRRQGVEATLREWGLLCSDRSISAGIHGKPPPTRSPVNQFSGG